MHACISKDIYFFIPLKGIWIRANAILLAKIVRIKLHYNIGERMKGKMVLVTVGMLLMMPSFAISITPNHIGRSHKPQNAPSGYSPAEPENGKVSTGYQPGASNLEQI